MPPIRPRPPGRWRVPAQRRESPVVAFQSGASAQPSPQPPAAPLVPEPVSPETVPSTRPRMPSPNQPSTTATTGRAPPPDIPCGPRDLRPGAGGPARPPLPAGRHGLRLALDTFLPWTFVPLALARAGRAAEPGQVGRRRDPAGRGVWGGDFGPQLARSGGTGPADLRILSQNVSSPPDLTAVANLADQRQADLVVLQGLTARDVQAADRSVPGAPLPPGDLRVRGLVAVPAGQRQRADGPGDPPGRPEPGRAGSGASSGQFGGLLRFTVQAGPGAGGHRLRRPPAAAVACPTTASASPGMTRWSSW